MPATVVTPWGATLQVAGTCVSYTDFQFKSPTKIDGLPHIGGRPQGRAKPTQVRGLDRAVSTEDGDGGRGDSNCTMRFTLR